jgi:hypothetical protein
MKELLNNNYIIIDDFISKEYANNLYSLLKNQVKSNKTDFEYIPELYGDAYGIRDFKDALKLLVNKIPEISKLIGQEVFPTYSYIRMYHHHSKLIEHLDRPSCEISVTLHLGSDGHDWPVGIQKSDGEKVTHILKPGQAMVYLGCEARHWREGLYEGDEYGQVFLHYVLADGLRWNHFFDRHIKV